MENTVTMVVGAWPSVTKDSKEEVQFKIQSMVLARFTQNATNALNKMRIQDILATQKLLNTITVC